MAEYAKIAALRTSGFLPFSRLNLQLKFLMEDIEKN